MPKLVMPTWMKPGEPTALTNIGPPLSPWQVSRLVRPAQIMVASIGTSAVAYAVRHSAALTTGTFACCMRSGKCTPPPPGPVT
jgi:hypothetical protein